MRAETRRRLEQALLMRRLKWIGAVLACVGLVGAGLAFQSLDGAVTTHPIAGTVISVGPLVGKYARVGAPGDVEVDIKLDDARIARLVTPNVKAPRVGEHVTIAELVHGTGRRTFGWK